MRKILNFNYEEFSSPEELNTQDQTLFAKALSAIETAYAPYSKFSVGAAVKLISGEFVLGSNQENIAYPSGLCAERVALFSAAANFPGVQFEAIAIAAKPIAHDPKLTVSPCGACRQVILEYERLLKKPIRIITGTENGKVTVIEKAVDLLPLAFFDSGL